MAHRNFLKQSVSNAPGVAGNLTLGAAVAGSLALGAGDDGQIFNLRIQQAGLGSEARTGSVYTHSGSTLTRGTLENSTTGSALDFTSAAVVSVVATADDGRRWDSAALAHVAGTDADTTMAVGMLYVTPMSAWATADRTYTLPATAAVGSRIGIMVTSGNASYELIIKPNTGDTINGGGAAAEWSRLFITGEVVILRCVTADSAWVVEHDGRIPCAASMYLAADEGSKLASQWNKVGVDTALLNIGGVSDTANERFNIRRAGNYDVKGLLSLSLAASGAVLLTLYVDGVNLQYLTRNTTVGSTGIHMTFGAMLLSGAVVGNYLELYAFHIADTQTFQGGDVFDGSRFYLTEVL